MSTYIIALTEALENFKHATARLSKVWQESDDPWIRRYPSYLPSFDEFNCDVAEMSFGPAEPELPELPELPEMPPVGTIVRARYDLDGAAPSFIWPKGWTGEIVNIPTPDEGDTVDVRAHRYLGPGAHEWDNCRVISLDDAYATYEYTFNITVPEGTDKSKLMAFALLHEFEVIS